MASIGAPSRLATVSTVRSATPRAVVYFTPSTGIGAGRAVLDQSAVGQEIRLPSRSIDAGTMPRWTSDTCSG